MTAPPPPEETRTVIDALLAEQRELTAVEHFARWHESHDSRPAPSYRHLLPLTAPAAGEQYAFEVDLDRCSGCKSCVAACHSLNGLDDGETWRGVGLLVTQPSTLNSQPFTQHVTTACHHCVDPGCLNGCPVLAYDKDPLTGIVRHLDDQCIGCQYCVFMCPYDVPKYSVARGIVRKCDMCHQRLAHGEAPACVQACPNEAIRITVVEQETIRNDYRVPGQVGTSRCDVPARAERAERTTRDAQIAPNVAPLVRGADGAARRPYRPFLPASPDPAITLPTTRYVSARPLPENLLAGDAHEAPLQAAHWPLVWMLVLTQLGAGGFLFLALDFRAAQPGLAIIALASTLLGLAGSFLHLGRPRKAWRAFLGLRRSWLSREIVVFGAFALLALASAIPQITNLRYAGGKPALLWATALVGLAGVFCSGMVYHVTRRECWRGERSFGRFFGSTLTLGAAATWLATELAGVGSIVPIAVLASVTLVKVSRESSWLRSCPDDADRNDEVPATPLARCAFLMRFRLSQPLRFQFACAWLGGIILPLLNLLSPSAGSGLAMVGFALCLMGDLAGRALFFRAAVAPKMPGGMSV
jgi:Fe-S-cluster-containing dehydrogenase component/DMSO reductase anchor subunit